jgi:copper/silver efflux system protein
VIQKIIEYSVQNRFVVIAVVLAVALIGIYSLARTPIDAIPDLSENQVIVFADWMGRSPQEIEDQVTYPLSVNLQGLAGVKAVRSTSEFNFSMINVIFEDKVDIYFARQRVLERLSTASTFLPGGVVPYLAPDATALGQIFWYTVEGDGRDLGDLRAIQDWYVRYQLNAVPGVAEVGSVGGFVKTYEIAIDPNRLRAYGITLGSVVSSVERSNSAVGGNVFIKNGAEYLIRGVGWIRNLDDIRRIVVRERGGVPITVEQLGAVQVAPEARRSILEKDGREAVGGVVVMRYGENPLEVTKRIKQKIADLAPGLPPGVRIVPFYDRTRLIGDAIHTVTRTLREEMLIAAIAILLILTHAGSAFVVVLTLPLAVLFAFIMMRVFNIPSNIMSLSGIAISIGILVDAAIVMVENATHELTEKFGTGKVHGDTRPIILKAAKLVGRPIFFSVAIMLISFLPVFVLTGQEGKMFHPLAYTKTFAMIGVALLAITLVPALLPIFLRGRLRSEEENPIVRSFIAIYKPVLQFLLRHRKAFIWSFIVLLGVGFNMARHLGREFMPPLDEGSILEMPVTIPSASARQVADDIKVRDAVLRSFPEVESVVGKAGRADTPTDPAPLDMIETVINLRPKEGWPERKVRFEDVSKEGKKLLAAMQGSGVVGQGLSKDDQAAVVNNAAMDATLDVDRVLRGMAMREAAAIEAQMPSALTRRALDELIREARAGHALSTPVPPPVREALTAGLAPVFGARLANQPGKAEVTSFLTAARDSLAARNLLVAGADPLRERTSRLAALGDPILALLGRERPGIDERVLAGIEETRRSIWKKRIKSLNYALSDRAAGELLTSLANRLYEKASNGGFAAREITSEDIDALRKKRERPLARGLFLWHKTKGDLVQEMDSELRMPGWGNIWTQPIINRVDMLATGVRTMIGVKVFGTDLNEIQKVSEDVAQVLRAIPGAVDVFPDQIVGENYLDIEIDREKAARYGVNVGDIQDVIEVALGGKTITSTVEGRQRFPVRVRYARDFRDDEESIGRVLVAGSASAAMGGGGGGTGSAGGSGGAPTGGGAMGGSSSGQGSMGGGSGAMGGSAGATPSPAGGGLTDLAAAASVTPLAAASSAGPAQIPLSQVATIQIVQGPSMIKSENGMLRSYVQLNVRDRDIVGFVEEAQRLVQERVKLPQGYYLEWSGQFEHQMRAKRTLQIVFPAVIALILLILYLTFHDVAQALLMVLAVPGALVGGVIFQTIFGFNFSVAVWVGYIAAFGMATETGIVMMVYLRDALDRKGGLAAIKSEAEITEAVVRGAVHRLRPKLLTEAVAIVGLMPMLWAHGTGAEVMRPMAAPVLGGLLVADEVIDLLLPVLFHWLMTNRWRRMVRGRVTA